MRRRGFTLFELLITTAIFGILTALMFSNFSREKQRNAIKGSMQQLQTDIQAMQTNALAGVTVPEVKKCSVSATVCTSSATCGGGTDVCVDAGVRGFGVHLDQNATSYTLYADNASGAQYFQTPGTMATDDVILFTRRLGTGVVFVSATADIEFTSPNGKAVLLGGGASKTLILRQPDLNTCYALDVTSNVGTTSFRRLTGCP